METETKNPIHERLREAIEGKFPSFQAAAVAAKLDRNYFTKLFSRKESVPGGNSLNQIAVALGIGRTLSGLVMMLLMPVGIVMMLNKNHYGAFLVIFFVAWVIVDLFLISGMLKSQKENVRSAMTKELTAKNQTP